MNDIFILGGDQPCGAYLLRIHITEDLSVRFGRFRKGSSIPIPHGDVLYIGSAMARSGSMTLARRVLRHATRRPPRPPHGIRPKLLETLKTAGLAPHDIQPPREKTLFWNIDYLLDEEGAQLSRLYLLRSESDLENALAELLLADSACRPMAPGLGAHDNPGRTHLLHVRKDDQWWLDLLFRLARLLNK